MWNELKHNKYWLQSRRFVSNIFFPVWKLIKWLSRPVVWFFRSPFFRGVLVSGIIAALVTTVMPYWISNSNRQEMVSNYFESLSKANISSAHSSKVFVEPGSDAEEYSNVIISLWRASYSWKGHSTSDDYGLAGGLELGGTTLQSYKLRPVIFQLPEADAMPHGVKYLADDFVFGDTGRLESFSLDGVPVGSLAFYYGEDSTRRNRFQDSENGLISAFQNSKLLTPDLATSFTSYEIYYNRKRDSTHDYAEFVEVTHIEDFSESPVDGKILFPDRIHRFEASDAAVVLETSKNGFVRLCFRHASSEEVSSGDERVQGIQCNWLNIQW